MRYVMSGATLFEEGDDSAVFATTLTTNNNHTGSAGTKHHQTHSLIQKAGSGMCTKRSDGKHSYI